MSKVILKKKEELRKMKRNLEEGATDIDEIEMKMGLSRKEREAVYGELGLSSDGE